MKFLGIAAALLGGFLTTGAASAATMVYTNVEPTPKIQLTVTDDAPVPADRVRFSLETLVGEADYLALGFNYDGPGTLTTGSIANLSATNEAGATTTPSFQMYGDGTTKVSDCGTGCNFLGAGSATLFDYIIRIAEPGGNGINYVRSVVFDIVTAAGALDFTQFAVRATSTTNPGGSIKTDLAPVPLPASGLLLLAGLGGLAVARRRRKAA